MHLGLYEGIYRLKIIKLTILRIYSVIMLRDFNADNFEFRFALGERSGPVRKPSSGRDSSPEPSRSTLTSTRSKKMNHAKFDDL